MENSVEILNELDRQETTYIGLYLGSQVKLKKSNPEEKYGVISLYFNGINTQGVKWYSVQDQYFNVESMESIVKDIDFGAKVKATFSCGNTPGGKQRLMKLEKI